MCLGTVTAIIPGMNATEFKASMSAVQPPAELHLALKALWWDAKGDWGKAHECVQALEGTHDDKDGAAVHAYLHRKEGDATNAAYWYRRASKPVYTDSLEAEWEALVSAFAR